MKLPFTKLHGAGNDFVAIDATQKPFHATPSQLAQWGDRNLGIGFDQLIIVGPSTSTDVDFDYRIYNQDGSESGMSGNGARCLARFIYERGLSSKTRLRVRTRTRVVELERLGSDQFRVNMDAPRFAPADIPLRRPQREPRYALSLDGNEIRFGAASMGNPHAVIETADVENAPVQTLSPRVQAHADFPQGVNVGFMQVVDAGNIRLRVYERGAGETLACGSGACAAVAVGRIWGQLSACVNVRVRGGELVVEWAGEGQPLYLSGPAVTVYQGELDWPT